jgi:protein SCO1/2
LSRFGAIRAAQCGAAVMMALSVAASGVQHFRLAQWPAAAPTPAFNLVDAKGRPRTLADYRGKVVVIFFGFTHCPDICPTELLKLSQVVKRMGPRASRMQVLFISLDTERDTPAALRTYVSAFNPRFVGLTGTAAAINASASSFSVQFAKVVQGGDYTINHSTGTYIFDKTGHLRLIATMAASIDDLVHDLSELASE